MGGQSSISFLIISCISSVINELTYILIGRICQRKFSVRLNTIDLKQNSSKWNWSILSLFFVDYRTWYWLQHYVLFYRKKNALFGAQWHCKYLFCSFMYHFFSSTAIEISIILVSWFGRYFRKSQFYMKFIWHWSVDMAAIFVKLRSWDR